MIFAEGVGIDKRTGKFFDIIMILSIALLFGLISYTRFYLYHDRYAAFFRLAWDPSLYPGDFIRDHLLVKCSIFYKLLSYLTPAVKQIGEENTLFIIYLINNFLVLAGCYMTGMIYGLRKLAMFFVVLLFTGWDLLPGASLSIVYAHHLSQTAFALMPALLSIYFFIKKRFTAFFISFYTASLIHMRTGFAIGVPLVFCALWDILRSPEDRKRLLRSFIFTAPIWAFVVYLYLKSAAGFEKSADLVKAMAENEINETDMLSINIGRFGFSIANYIFMHILAIFALWRYRVTNFIDKRIVGLILAANIGLLLGVFISLVYRYIIPIPFLLFLWWPKIAMVSTYLCLLFICRHLVFNSDFWQALNPLSMGFALFFMTGSLLNINILGAKFMLKSLILIFSFYCILYFSKKLKREDSNRFFSIVFMLFTVFGNVYVNLRYFQETLNDRQKYGWNATIYRPPFLFSSYAQEYDAIKWLNNDAGLSDMYIFPMVEEGGVTFANFRGYGRIPLFYQSRLEDVYGSAKKYEEWKQRKGLLRDWLDNKNTDILLNANIKYVIIEKKDEDFFKIPFDYCVYSNKEIMVYKITRH